jgi:hypothetical protein
LVGVARIELKVARCRSGAGFRADGTRARVTRHLSERESPYAGCHARPAATEILGKLPQRGHAVQFNCG